MASAPSKLYADDVSLLVVLLDTNPFFWSASSLPFSKFISHGISFLNSVLLLNQLNQIVVIATGHNCCDYLYDSSSPANRSSGTGKLSALSVDLLEKLEEFVIRDEKLLKKEPEGSIPSSLLSGSLSMALCSDLLTKNVKFERQGVTFMRLTENVFDLIRLSDIQRVFRSGPLHPHPRILCLHGSQDGPEQYVAIMNAIFSAQRSMVPIDSCFIGAQNSAFLQQASYITGGVYLKPQLLDGTFQYLSTVFATDLHSRGFLQLPKSVGIDFRASCFCHKKTIDMGYICSVCLSIFCKHHKKCSTCGSVFGQPQSDAASEPNKKRKAGDP